MTNHFTQEEARTALEQALDALGDASDYINRYAIPSHQLDLDKIDAALTAGREALAAVDAKLAKAGEQETAFSQENYDVTFPSSAGRKRLQSTALPAPESDLSGLKPNTQERIREWLTDGTFVSRAIGVMREQERELMTYEKAVASALLEAQPKREPLTNEQIDRIGLQFSDFDDPESFRVMARAVESHLKKAHKIGVRG